MEPITFRMKPSSKSFTIVMIIAMLIPGLYAAFEIWDTLPLVLIGEISGLLIIALGFVVVFSIVAVAVVVFVVGIPKNRGPEYEFLQIDQTGLNYMRHGKSRSWAWNELSGFNLASKYRRIEFLLPGADGKAAKHDSWVHETTPDGPIAVIKDIYDASLDDIAATLNAYREQAIGER